jgi:hypothetical protein
MHEWSIKSNGVFIFKSIDNSNNNKASFLLHPPFGLLDSRPENVITDCRSHLRGCSPSQVTARQFIVNEFLSLPFLSQRTCLCVSFVAKIDFFSSLGSQQVHAISIEREAERSKLVASTNSD